MARLRLLFALLAAAVAAVADAAPVHRRLARHRYLAAHSTKPRPLAPVLARA